LRFISPLTRKDDPGSEVKSALARPSPDKKQIGQDSFWRSSATVLSYGQSERLEERWGLWTIKADG
jgi:hypothetical protein